MIYFLGFYILSHDYIYKFFKIFRKILFKLNFIKKYKIKVFLRIDMESSLLPNLVIIYYQQLKVTSASRSCLGR